MKRLKIHSLYNQILLEWRKISDFHSWQIKMSIFSIDRKSHSKENLPFHSLEFMPLYLRPVHDLRCVAVPIYRLLSASSHRSITAFQVKMNLTFMRHRKMYSYRNFCARQCSAATQRTCGKSINGSLHLIQQILNCLDLISL